MCLYHLAAGLTIDNVRKTLHGIPWREVGRMLFIPYSKRREIDLEYPSDEECQVAVIRYWILRDPFASWRRIIEQLEDWGKHDYSIRIRQYSEELTGMGMTHIQCTCNISMLFLCVHVQHLYMKVGVACPLVY